MKRHVILSAITALLLGGGIEGCGTGARAAAQPADSVRGAVLGPDDVARAARRDLVAGIPVSGTLEPSLEVRITAPIAEVVERVFVKEGQAVRRGQVLARFRTSAAEPAALSAEAQRRKAAADYERMQNLYKEGAVSEQDVESAEVGLRAAQAAEASARKHLDEATVRAPASGVISQRAVDSGDRVKDGNLMFQLVNTDELEFAATVPAEYVEQVHVGAPVMLTVPGVDSSITGHVARVNATVDAATRQVKVYLTVPNPAHRLVGGLFAAGRIVLRQVTNAVAVPVDAVRTDPAGGSYVLVVAAGHIARRDVQVGATDERASQVEITSGLQGGETVIVGPANGLEAGEAATVAGSEG